MPSDAVFAALADPTRRQVLQLVAERGPTSATALERDLPVTRQAVVKHLVVLSRAGLVARRREGQEVRYALTPEPLSQAAEWLEEIGARWDARLARLQAYLSLKGASSRELEPSPSTGTMTSGERNE